jgi:crossover junction endodeoxyribonuclease RuvC
MGWANIETKKLRGTERLIYIRDTLLKIIDDLAPCTIQRIAMEGYSFGSRGRATFSLGELGGVLKISLTSVAELVSIQPTMLKKFTGSGRAEKEDVVKFVNKEMNLSFTTKDNDICDACVLAMIARQIDEPTTQLRHQLEVLQTIKDSNEG